MKKLTIFILANCPYCKAALADLGELMNDDKYSAIEVELVEEQEQADLAAGFDYYYVPSFFYKNQKLHEGATTRESIVAVLDAVCNDAA